MWKTVFYRPVEEYRKKTRSVRCISGKKKKENDTAWLSPHLYQILGLFKAVQFAASSVCLCDVLTRRAQLMQTSHKEVTAETMTVKDQLQKINASLRYRSSD
jgi:hypothetical protein